LFFIGNEACKAYASILKNISFAGFIIINALFIVLFCINELVNSVCFFIGNEACKAHASILKNVSFAGFIIISFVFSVVYVSLNCLQAAFVGLMKIKRSRVYCCNGRKICLNSSLVNQS